MLPWIYDDHYHSVASGCPLPRDTKLKYVTKAELCPDCLDQNFQRKRGAPHVDCPVRKKKSFYTCRADGCSRHYWLCKTREALNKRNLDKCKFYWQEKGKIFANMTHVLRTSPKKVTPQKHSTSAGKSVNPKEAGENFDHTSTTTSNSFNIKTKSRKKNKGNKSKIIGASSSVDRGCCIEDATKKL